MDSNGITPPGWATDGGWHRVVSVLGREVCCAEHVFLPFWTLGSMAFELKKMDEGTGQVKTEGAIYRRTNLTTPHSHLFLSRASQNQYVLSVSPRANQKLSSNLRFSHVILLQYSWKSDPGRAIKLKHYAAVRSWMPLEGSQPCEIPSFR